MKICLHCEQPFQPRGKHQLCSDACTWARQRAQEKAWRRAKKGMGDTDTADFAALAEAMEPGREYPFAELVELAAELGAFEGLVNQIEEGGKASSGARNRLARILSRFNGRRATAAGHFVCKGKGHARRFSMRVVHE